MRAKVTVKVAVSPAAPKLSVEGSTVTSMPAMPCTEAVKVPALVIYGGADTIIPPAHSERLAAAWGGPVERLQLPASGHNDIDVDPRYARAIAAFLDRHL